MPEKNESKSQPNPRSKRLSLAEYQATKDKLVKMNSENRLPLAVKLFIAFPIFVLILLFCFGIFYIPHLSTLETPSETENNTTTH